MRKLNLNFFSGRFKGKSIIYALIGLVINIAVLALLALAFVSFSNNLIGVEAAKADALAYANVSENEANDISVQLRFEKLKLYYFVEFEVNGNVYEFQMAARTGDLVNSN